MREDQNQHFAPKVDSAPDMEGENLRLSFQDIVSATVEPGDGALSKLWSYLSLLPKDQSQEIYELLMDLELRTRRYLITKENSGKKKQQPTIYARLLVDAVNSEEETSRSAQRALVELSSVVVAELTPILRRIHAVIAEIAPSLSTMQTIQNLSTNDGLLHALSQGSSGREDVPSFFGILQSLNEKVKDFPSINLSEVTIPQRLIIENPLGDDTVGYFKERQDIFASIYDRKISLPQLLASRSLSVAYELGTTTQHIAREVKRDAAQLENLEDDTQREKMQAEIDGKRNLQRTYATLTQWVRTAAESLEGVSDTSFQSHVASLTFAWGDPEEITDLLNGLEVVKHDNPELYARMLGIQAQVASSEVQRSDLFGNALHIAFHHSLHARTTSDIQGSQFFHDRIVKLTELDATQDVLVHINERQWQKLEKLLVPQASGIAQGSVTELWKAKQYVEFFQSYQLRKMLEEADMEKREELLNNLRTATPLEFIRSMTDRRLLSRGLAWYEDYEFPADVVPVLKERGFEVDDKEARVRIVIAIESVHSFFWASEVATRILGRTIRSATDTTLPVGNRYFNTRGESFNINIIKDSKKNWDAIVTELWKTTPSEKILGGKEFFEYIGLIVAEMHVLIKKNEKRFTDDYTKLDKMGLDDGSRILEHFFAVLSAHPDITKEQWTDWYIRQTKSAIPLMIRPLSGWSQDYAPIDNRKSIGTMRDLFEIFLPRYVIECNSRFFVIADALFKPTLLSANNSPILRHFPRLNSDNNELLRVDADLRDPHVKLLVQYRTTDTKEFLKQHREEFEKVDLDILFSILSPEEQIDILNAIFDDKKDDNFYWKVLNAGRNENLGTIHVKKTMQKYKFVQWRMKLLNIAERFIPENENYKKIEDFYFTIKTDDTTMKYRCVKKKIEDGASEHKWSLEFEVIPQVWETAIMV